MKTLPKLSLLIGLFTYFTSYSQTNARLMNPDYMFTPLLEHFDSPNGINTSKWQIDHNTYRYDKAKTLLFRWDQDQTNQQNGSLLLSMDKVAIPFRAYNEKKGDSVDVHYIAGQISSIDNFGYGIYECYAHFSCAEGSFPAFWTISRENCSQTFTNEVDIVELRYDHHFPTLDNNLFYYPDCDPDSADCAFDPMIENPFIWNSPNLFKMVWDPEKLQYWVNNTMLYEVTNTGQYWFPVYRQHLVLSQQITMFNYNSPFYGITTPQTSLFHWVKVREYFLAPELSCEDVICSTDTVILDVDSRASNITWSLTPASLFSGPTSGTGITAIIDPLFSNGNGKITYNFEMPSGETYSAEKTFWVGEPYVNPNSIIFENSEASPGSLCANAFGNNFSFTYDHDFNYFNVKLTNLAETQTICSFTIYDTQGDLDMCSVNEGTYMFWVRGNNDCGTATNWSKTAVTFEDCWGMMMMMAPNPTSGETIISLEPKTENTTFDENEGWDVEIYSETMQLKDKKDKLKTKDYKVKTNDWKEGVYTVRAKYKEQILTGKLVVKK